MAAHYHEHFEPTSLSVSEEGNFNGDSKVLTNEGETAGPINTCCDAKRGTTYAIHLLALLLLLVWEQRPPVGESHSREAMEHTTAPVPGSCLTELHVLTLLTDPSSRESIWHLQRSQRCRHSSLSGCCHEHTTVGHPSRPFPLYLFTCNHVQAKYILWVKRAHIFRHAPWGAKESWGNSNNTKTCSNKYVLVWH